jgi:hypothetical protein
MSNKSGPALVYRPSSLGEILKTARECSVNENMRTKAELSEQLGMTVKRMTSIEGNFSRISLNEALDWCDACEDEMARQAVMHIFGVTRIPTDPRLIAKLEQQLVNYIDQAQKGIQAAQRLLQMSKDMRPGQHFGKAQINRIIEDAGQIDDTYQSSECVLLSIEKNWSIRWAEIQNRWMSEAIVDRVAVDSVDQFVKIEKERALGWTS